MSVRRTGWQDRIGQDRDRIGGVGDWRTSKTSTSTSGGGIFCRKANEAEGGENSIGGSVEGGMRR